MFELPSMPHSDWIRWHGVADAAAHTTTLPAGVAIVVDSHDNEPFRELEASLAVAANLSEDWDGFGAPSPRPAAMMNAQRVLDACRIANFLPSSVGPSSQGGVAVVFRLGVHYADIECFNDGDILAAFDRGEGAPDIWPVRNDPTSIRATIDEIRVRFCE
jgi:hypothetical protein